MLITAGNTWTPIDDVRVMTNIFSGQTGLTLAKRIAKAGYNVTVILADHRVNLSDYEHKRITIKHAVTYDAFYKRVKKEVKKQCYSVLIHAAAVSDFALKKPLKGKASSKKKLKLMLKKTKKIADKIKIWDPRIILIKFKLESRIKKRKLIQIALKSKAASHANLIIANKLPFTKKHGYLLIKNRDQIQPIKGRKQLANRLVKIFKRELSE